MKNRLVFVCSLLLSAQLLVAQKISEWREENRTGVSAETGLLKSWPEGGPAMLWVSPEIPKGYSSVSFGDNRIFLTGIVDQNDVVVALDTTGNIVWQTPYGRAWKESFPESRCTPTVEGDKLYVSSGLGDVACLDAKSGAIIWSVKASEMFKGTYGPWGIAESIIIDGEKIYFTTGGPETTTIAMNKNNGNVLWKSESIDDFPGYVSPVLIDYSGKKLIVNVTGKHIIAVDPDKGHIVWKINHYTLRTAKKPLQWDDAPGIKCVTPLYSNGKIYVTGGYDHGSFMLNLTDGGNNANIAWMDSVLDVHHGGVVLVNGYIFGSNWINNGDGNWCCLDWNTGKKMWEEHWKCKGSIIAADGLLYIYDEKSGFVGLLRPNPEKFDLISSFKVPKGTGPNWAHPVIHHGKLYIRHGNSLMVFDIKNH